MRILFYLLTLMCGAFGLLALARVVEVLATGGIINPIQVLFAVIGLALAVVCLKKARSQSSP